MGGHMNLSTNPSAVRSRAEITAALLELMKKYDYADITVKQIILETKLVRKTFYRNFHSKDDVLDSYISSLLADYVSALTRPGADILEVIFDNCIKNRDFLLILHKNNLLYRVMTLINEYIICAHNETDPSVNPFSAYLEGLEPDYPIAFTVGGIWSVISKWVSDGMTEQPEQIIACLRGYLDALSHRNGGNACDA